MTKLYDNNTKDLGAKSRQIRCFVFLELFLFGVFLVFDFGQMMPTLSNILKYIAIWLCFILAVFAYVESKRKQVLCMAVILFFTVLSDTFLLFTNLFEFGILSFILVQILYSRKIKTVCEDGCRVYMLEMLLITFLWNLFILALRNEKLLTPIIALASLYFLLFTLNLIKSWYLVYKSKKNGQDKREQNVNKFFGNELALAVGLTLFYLCDIHVGLHFLFASRNQDTELIKGVTYLTGNLMWFFYLPSQVILTLNSIMYKRKI